MQSSQMPPTLRSATMIHTFLTVGVVGIQAVFALLS
jgi:hypothetical protein